jgi:hypothetical protein
MPTDLPTAIREALHADEIDAMDLRQPVLRERRPPRSRTPRVLAAAAGAAVVVAVVAVVSVLGSNGHGSRTPTASGSGFLLGVAGYRWDVATVHDAHGQFRLPPSLDAWIGFTGDKHQVLGSNSVNALTGHLAPAPGGYQVTDAGTTYAVYLGSDPIRQRTIEAVDAMFYTDALDPDAQPRPVRVQVGLADNERTLTLSHGTVALALTRSGTVTDSTPDGSQTATPTVARTTTAPTATTPSGPATPGTSSLAPADTTAFPAKGCAPDPRPTVTITIDPSTPVPTCVIVHGSQRLRVVNATNASNQPGKAITVNIASLPERVVAEGQSTTYGQPFDSYLAPGEHVLDVSFYPRSNVIIWLK